MMTEPLTPPDCDLRGLSYMPLDVQRLRDSDLALTSTGDEFKAAVLLWCASWSQVPAASLPDDDRLLAGLARFDARMWKRVRPAALRGWVKCSDGRLYHPVVAEKAREAWKDRGEYRAKREKDRERLAAWRESQKRAGEASGNWIETRFETRLETQPEEKGTGSEGIIEPPNPPGGGGEPSLLREAMAVFPPAGLANVSLAKLDPLWAEHAALAGEARLLAAVRAFAVSLAMAAGGKPRRMDRWLADMAYEQHLDHGTATGTWPGPPEVEAAVSAALGPAKASVFLARCRWRDVPERAIVTEHAYVAETLRTEAGNALAPLALSILHEPKEAAA